MLRVSIIGTAGRKDDKIRMNKDIYWAMYEQAKKNINEMLVETNNTSETLEVISGGAAWADHVAVSLYMRDVAKYCTLHLPANFYNSRFIPTDGAKEAHNIANWYHKTFSQKMGGSTLRGIQMALDKGAKKVVTPGFYARNKKVAKCDRLIAFTWGPYSSINYQDRVRADADTAGLKDGGTAHTWNCSTAKVKIHHSLHHLGTS